MRKAVLLAMLLAGAAGGEGGSGYFVAIFGGSEHPSNGSAPVLSQLLLLQQLQFDADMAAA